MSRAAAPSNRQPKPPVALPITRGHRWRMRSVFWFLLLLFSALAARLVQLQARPDLIFSREELGHIGTVIVQIPRGDVLDRDGRLLATDRRVRSLSADPSRTDEPERLARELAVRLGMEEDVILSRLAREDAAGRRMKFVWIKRWLTQEDIDALGEVESLGRGALRIEYEPIRFYPEGTLASHVVGYVNRERVGSSGIELAFDRHLRTTDGRYRARVDRDRRVLSSLTLDYTAPTGGANVHLTIDKGIQHKLEQRLAQALDECQADRGAGIVMNPHTGAILALACVPTYDPNRFWEASDEDRKNHAVVDVFEPGSAFKIVTAAAALEHGLITPETRIDCENGSFNPYGHRISDFHRLGVEPFTTCFSESSNIAIIKVAAMLGPERLEEWIRRFGFGQRTGADFGAAESAGIFRPVSQWSRLSMGSLPMGQEISVTLPQMARAFSVIANGGYLVEPYLVEKAVGQGGELVYAHNHATKRRVLSQQTADIMKELCHGVVTHGTGRYANIPEYRVGGKTGTAQVAEENGRGYKKGKYITVFAGFAPIADPQLCAVIVVNEPRIRLHYGGYVCGPVFKDVAREALISLNVPKDPVRDPVRQAAVEPEDPDTVAARFDMELLEPDLEEILAPLDGLELINLAADSSFRGPGLPNFKGMTKQQARDLVAQLGLHWDIQGAGWVWAQDPPPGTPLADISLVRLVFKSAEFAKSDETGALAENPKR